VNSPSSSSLQFPPHYVEIWNLTQRIGHLESALNQTRAANSAISDEFTRLQNVESDLEQQQRFNVPLVDKYLQIMEDEENRLFRRNGHQD
jgi:hypothetical protein